MHRCHICGQFLGTSYALSAHRAYVHGTGVGYAGTKTDDEIPSFVSSGVEVSATVKCEYGGNHSRAACTCDPHQQVEEPEWDGQVTYPR